MLPKFATLSVKVLEAQVEQPKGLDIKGPSLLKVALGHQRYKTSSLLPSPTFTFTLTLHAHLFFILQVDYFLQRSSSIFKTREHVGRTQLRVRLLENVQESGMTGWWEMRDKSACFLPLDELGKLPDDPRDNTTVGTIKLELKWSRTFEPVPSVIVPVMAVETIDRVADAEALISTGQPLIGEEGALSSSPSNSSLSYIDADSAAMEQVQGSESIEKAVDQQKTINSVKLHVSRSTAVFQKMANRFMSGADYKALLTIQALLLAFNQGIEVGGVAMTRAFILLQKYYNARPLLSEVNSSNNRKVQRSKLALPRQLFRFVIASFGWMGVTYTGKGKGLIDGMRSQADAKTVKEYLKLAEGDLLHSNFDSPGAFRPVFFVAFDKDLRAIIVSVRGTMHAYDALTDLVCDYIEWKQPNGFVHSGILAAAQWIFEQVIDLIIEEASNRSTHNIYITGHSMGGGTAILLTMLFLDRLDRNIFNIQCASFGPPPVVSESLRDIYANHINVFVNNEDGVPRLCYGSAVDLQCIMLYCSQVSSKAWSLGALPEQLIGCLDVCRKLIHSRSQSVKLYHPGHVHLLCCDNGTSTLALNVGHDFFSELRVTKRMLFDHLPDQYERSLDAAYVNYLMQELENAAIQDYTDTDTEDELTE